MHTQASVLACGPPTLLSPLISEPGCSWTYVKVEEGQPPTPCSSLLSQELVGWISRLPLPHPPPILVFHSEHVGNPSISHPEPHLLLALWSILSKSITAIWRVDWIILTFWICSYLYVFFCRFLSRRSEREREGAVVSCLVWIHSDSDSLSFCSISHCCNVMGCESQGQFAQSICVLLSVLCIVFVFFCVCVFTCLHCVLTLPPYPSVCVCHCV